ncbi:MAG: hypothetical protein BECKG1743D_GA0114223_102314 [Candidatus Kentron sp. G]|nr:MAG: hypothetical protein BECKG1743E_GA0114224_100975 [Candidatus Kentron sp. G]VFM96939.1 MAG: hypothetical protein BECKG1743F_GA0114225_102094 [Candidatus Kentron sp. G]VFN00885.1 MAG: hypothetical protein BECKG1743D_GA0114223_102314 [Candidatus Kentron sp. G]
MGHDPAFAFTPIGNLGRYLVRDSSGEPDNKPIVYPECAAFGQVGVDQSVISCRIRREDETPRREGETPAELRPPGRTSNFSSIEHREAMKKSPAYRGGRGIFSQPPGAGKRPRPST